MKFILTVSLIVIFGLSAFATPQMSDKIIYNGIEYQMHSTPLEAYFGKHPDKRPKASMLMTSLWRGYVATYEVQDNELFLKDIHILSDNPDAEPDTQWQSVMEDVFPGEKKIKIDWLTGILVLPQGKIVNYVHMGFASTYENYILLEIDKGDMKNSKHLSHQEYKVFKDRQFQAFRQTEDYKRARAELEGKGSTEKFIDSFLKDHVIEYSSQLLVD